MLKNKVASITMLIGLISIATLSYVILVNRSTLTAINTNSETKINEQKSTIEETGMTNSQSKPEELPKYIDPSEIAQKDIKPFTSRNGDMISYSLQSCGADMKNPKLSIDLNNSWQFTEGEEYSSRANYEFNSVGKNLSISCGDVMGGPCYDCEFENINVLGHETDIQSFTTDGVFRNASYLYDINGNSFTIVSENISVGEFKNILQTISVKNN